MLRINHDGKAMSVTKVDEGGSGGGATVFPQAVQSPPPQTVIQPQTVVQSQTVMSTHTQRDSKPAEIAAKPDQRLSLLRRIRKIKHIEIYAACLVVLIMIGIYASNFIGAGNNDSLERQIQQNQAVFAREMEQRLVSTLSQIRGAGNVSAMVTVVGSSTLEIAYNVDERTVTQTGPNGTSNTTTTVIKTPVIINDRDGPRPLVLLEIKPRLVGVVVVASGAHDIGVRLAILRAVQTLTGNDNSINIEILAGR